MHYICHKCLQVISHLLSSHMKARTLLYSPSVGRPMLKHTENYRTGKKATMFKAEKQQSTIKCQSLYTKFYFFACLAFEVFHFISQIELELSAILLSKPLEYRDYSVCFTLDQHILYINKNQNYKFQICILMLFINLLKNSSFSGQLNLKHTKKIIFTVSTDSIRFNHMKKYLPTGTIRS